MDVRSGDRIVTGIDGRAEITVARLGRITVEADTIALIPEQATTLRLEIERGGVLARASELATGARFEIGTPTSAAGVRGTEFGVSHDPATGQTLVAVVEGSVVILPRSVAEEVLAAETGVSLETAARIVDRIYESSIVVEADQAITIGEQEADALSAAARAIVELARSLPGEDSDELASRLVEIQARVESTVTVTLSTRPLSADERARFETIPPVAPDTPPADDRDTGSTSTPGNADQAAPSTSRAATTAVSPSASTSPSPATDPEGEADALAREAAQAAPDREAAPAPEVTPADAAPQVDTPPADEPSPEARTAPAAEPAPEERAYREAMAMPVNRRVAAMYYPWFASQDFDGYWNEWDQLGRRPPRNWASEYEPLLGLYSSRNPDVLEQHMQWVRRAGVGTLVAAWFGPNSNDDDIRLLMQAAERYDIQVALRIEGDVPGNPGLLPAAIRYLSRTFANRPNYARIASASPTDPRATERPLVFVFGVDSKFDEWTAAMRTVRSQTDRPFVLASGWDRNAVIEGGMDGMALGPIPQPESGNYTEMRLLPSNAIFVPSITPGFASIYNRTERFDRLGGSLMDRQFEWAIRSGTTPAMIMITSFNRWSDGSQIEPVVQNPESGKLDYGAQGSFFYLDKTRQLAEQFARWQPPARMMLRIEIENSSDWADLVLSRVDWGAARIVQDGGPGTEAYFDWDTNLFGMNQPLLRARRGDEMDLVIELQIPATDSFELGIEKGSLGEVDVDVILLPSPGGPARERRIGEFSLEEPPDSDDGRVWFRVDVEGRSD
jgi:glycoprotein endo-alpha-1,2-mannosidase